MRKSSTISFLKSNIYTQNLGLQTFLELHELNNSYPSGENHHSCVCSYLIYIGPRIKLIIKGSDFFFKDFFYLTPALGTEKCNTINQTNKHKPYYLHIS